MRYLAALSAAALVVAATAPAMARANYDYMKQDAGFADLGAETSVEAGQANSPREVIAFHSDYEPGTIVVSTTERRLYFVTGPDEAISYGVGVGRPGFEWNGVQTITRMEKWPSWTPPADMLKRRPELPHRMAGGTANPLGARALYLGGTMYRIHGSNEPDSIGHAVSSGCIRMLNEDVEDLYGRVRVGTKVVVL